MSIQKNRLDLEILSDEESDFALGLALGVMIEKNKGKPIAKMAFQKVFVDKQLAPFSEKTISYANSPNRSFSKSFSSIKCNTTLKSPFRMDEPIDTREYLKLERQP